LAALVLVAARGAPHKCRKNCASDRRACLHHRGAAQGDGTATAPRWSFLLHHFRPVQGPAPQSRQCRRL